jgi:iron complex transport system substrate-binding protein
VKKGKMKTKIVARLEIAIVLCSVLLVATLPGIAAGQNQETLGIYGNANLDDTIDMRDITYTARIICWLEEPTELADANLDGKITARDMTQIGLIILGREKELTIIDSNERTVTLDMPIERVISLSTGGPAAPLCLLGVEDKLVGINGMIAKSPEYADLHDLPSVGYPGPDYEAIVELEPDLVMACTWAYGGEYGDVNMLESLGIRTVMFDLGNPATLHGVMKILGVMMGKEERAEEYIDFFHSTLSLVDEEVEGLTPEEKKTVYYEFAVRSEAYYKTGGRGSKFHEKILRAGGINIFADVPWSSFTADPEAVLEEDPDVVIIDAHATCSVYEMEDTIAMEQFREEIIDNRPGWNNMTAVKNGDLYVFAHETFLTTHVPVGICYLAKTLHPDTFSDLDPDAIKNEYLEKFFPDRDYLMDYQGSHVYPCKWCS